MVNGINLFSSSSSQRPSREDITSKLSSLGIPSDVISKGPDAVKEYADENGISLPAPPSPPSSSVFDETMQEQSLNGSTSSSKSQPPAELKQQLISSGIPASVIAEGPGAVKEYADENGITLPSPPEPPEGMNDEQISL